MVIGHRHIVQRRYRSFLDHPVDSLRAGVRRALGKVSSRIPGGLACSPANVTLIVTLRCNLSCSMCGQARVGGDMNPALAERICSQLSASRTSITIFGGEPLIHPQIAEILTSVKSSKLRCRIITNGTHLEALSAEIVAVGVDAVSVSIDGPQQTHDVIRGMKGVFAKARAGILALNAHKDRIGTKTPTISVQTTIAEENIGHLENFVFIVQDLGVDSLTFHHPMFIEPWTLENSKALLDTMFCNSGAQQLAGFARDPRIPVSDLLTQMSRVDELIESGKIKLSVGFCPEFTQDGIKDYYKPSCETAVNWGGRCRSPWLSAYVFPDGTIRPCFAFDYRFGNVNDQEFKFAWNGSRAKLFRNRLQQFGCPPTCRRCTELHRY